MDYESRVVNTLDRFRGGKSAELPQAERRSSFVAFVRVLFGTWHTGYPKVGFGIPYQTSVDGGSLKHPDLFNEK
jgi:hypothetical protein